MNEIENYIRTFSRTIQVILEKVQQTIKQAAPQAEETIKYLFFVIPLIEPIDKMGWSYFNRKTAYEIQNTGS